MCNVDDKSAVNGNKYVDMVREATKDENAEILIVAAQTESEIAEFETYEERQMFLEEIGLKESGVSRLIVRRSICSTWRPTLQLDRLRCVPGHITKAARHRSVPE